LALVTNPKLIRLRFWFCKLILDLINSQRVTGGVYKNRVQVHRIMLIYDY